MTVDDKILVWYSTRRTITEYVFMRIAARHEHVIYMGNNAMRVRPLRRRAPPFLMQRRVVRLLAL